MTTSEAKNLEAIAQAIEQHNRNCPFPASEVRMNPFEIERLGWDEVKGLPLVGDPELGTGRFRIVCSGEGSGEDLEEVEAIGEPIEADPVEVGTPTDPRESHEKITLADELLEIETTLDTSPVNSTVDRPS